jgi:hypothetical protein
MVVCADGAIISKLILGLGLSAFICVYLRTIAFCPHNFPLPSK